jgi:hypothetical protein
MIERKGLFAVAVFRVTSSPSNAVKMITIPADQPLFITPLLQKLML